MTTRTRIKKLGLLLFAAYFAGTYVFLGNPVIESFLDHGSDGLNSLPPCLELHFDVLISC